MSEYKKIKYAKLMINIVAHLNVLSRIVEKEIKDLNIPHNDFKSDIDTVYLI